MAQASIKKDLSFIYLVKETLSYATEFVKQILWNDTTSNVLSKETLDKIVGLKEAEIQLTMLYYKAYQEGKDRIEDFKKDQIKPREIIKELKLGPAQFYEKHHEIIEAKLTSDADK